jgi:hypothetical protein
VPRRLGHLGTRGAREVVKCLGLEDVGVWGILGIWRISGRIAEAELSWGVLGIWGMEEVSLGFCFSSCFLVKV